MNDERTEFGLAVEEELLELAAWKRGEIVLSVRHVDPMPPERVRAIYKSVSKSARDFERKFHIPAGTLHNWLQGRRKPDPTSCAYLTVIARDPEAVERALGLGGETDPAVPGSQAKRNEPPK